MKSHFIKMRSISILAFFALLLCIFPVIAYSQTVSPAIMAQVTSELQKRGLTEDEVRTRLLQKGIDVTNIPIADLPQYKDKITTVLDELQAEKRAASNINVHPDSLGKVINNSLHTSNPLNLPLVEPITTKQEAVAEAAQRVVQSDSKKGASRYIYGHSLFTDRSLDAFRTTDGAQAPETYILGDGDEIRITIFGASQTDIQQKIAPDGSIQPTDLAKIFVKGLTLSQARSLIRERLSTAYTFKPDQFAVTIVTARTIMINVFGETKITGGFNLSALNSAFNALSVAGGPTEIGSVRNIQLIRANSRKNIDLYTFMNDPATQFKLDLQNNDILFVPVIKTLVEIEGAVNRPMLYEMLPGETMLDLIHFAGGVKKDVFPDFIQVQRYINGEERLFEWNLEDIKSEKIKVPLMNGDVIRVKTIGKPMDQYVNVMGSVYYPGRYDLAANPTLEKLLEKAKPNYQAKTDFLFIERLRPDLTEELIQVPFPDKNSVKQFTLQPRDSIRILDLSEYRDIEKIDVIGHVRNPIQKKLSLNDRITVQQALDLAGGVKNSAYPVAYIFRKNMLNFSEVQYIRVKLEQADKINMQAGDQLIVYDNSTYTNVGEVNVYGAVKNSQKFTFDPSLTIRDVLTTSGGFKIGAAFNRIEVFRTLLSPTEKSRLEMITVQVDSSYQVVSPKNFSIHPYDQIVVRLTPEFMLGRTIELNGEVAYPGVYALESKQTNLSEIIRRAGGLLHDADLFGSSLFRTYKKRGNISFEMDKTLSKSGNIKYDPILFEGDVININRIENTVSIRDMGTRIAQYSVNSEGGSFKNVVFQGRRSAAWYIRNFAGGFMKKANHNSVTVTYANDQMISTKRYLIFLRHYPTVRPGSIITLQMKPPKEKSDNKKYDWDSMIGKTSAAITSSLTLYLLITQLSKL